MPDSVTRNDKLSAIAGRWNTSGSRGGISARERAAAGHALQAFDGRVAVLQCVGRRGHLAHRRRDGRLRARKEGTFTDIITFPAVRDPTGESFWTGRAHFR
jgi:hypothetical protein